MRQLLLVAVAMSLVALAPPAAAQDENVVGMMIHVKPKAGMKDKWEEGTKKHMAFHREKDDSWQWFVWEIVSGENAGDFVVGTFEHKWADFDNMPLDRAEDLANRKMNSGPYTESANIKYIADMPKHSVPPADGTPPGKLVSLVTVNAKPDKADAYMNAVRKISDAITKTGSDTKYYFSRAVTGGRQPSFIVFLPNKGWAGMAPSGTPFPKMLEEAYGNTEAEAIIRTLDESIYDYRTTLLAYREDLSYMPSSPSSE
jgi:hypothetical protein